MSATTKVILDFSNEVQELLDQQGVDLPRAMQEELPQIKLMDITDPESPAGSKDITTAILATAALLGALYPIIVRILNQFKPDTTEVCIEERITHDANGKPEYTRLSIFTEKKYNQQALTDSSKASKKPGLPEPGDTSEESAKNNLNALDQ
jgi:hypothetical protein